MLSQLDRVVLASHNVADDLQPGFAGDVTDDIIQLNIHQSQSLLHALDLAGSISDQIIPLSNVGSEADHFFVGANNMICLLCS